MKNEHITRKGTIDDADAIGRLHALSWMTAYRGLLPDAYLDGNLEEERLAHWQKKMRGLSSREFVVLSEDEKGLKGFICVIDEPFHQYTALIDNLHVRPDLKGLGLGGLLLDLAIGELRRMNLKGVYLWVIEGNTPAEHFYRSKGGREMDTKWFELGGARIREKSYVWDW